VSVVSGSHISIILEVTNDVKWLKTSGWGLGAREQQKTVGKANPKSKI
jgi:hypothetical protein